jgi:hypothetical protein
MSAAPEGVRHRASEPAFTDARIDSFDEAYLFRWKIGDRWDPSRSAATDVILAVQRPRKDIMAIVDMTTPCHRYGHPLEDRVASIVTQSMKDVRGLIADDARPAGSAAETA